MVKLQIDSPSKNLSGSIEAIFQWKRCFLLSPHSYFGRRKQSNVDCVLRRKNRSLHKPSRQKRWMGVGYKDSGTYRDVAIDGSPTWQEVASSERKIETRTPKEIQEEATLLWKLDRKKNSYNFYLDQVLQI
jgi:hypothetical protein